MVKEGLKEGGGRGERGSRGSGRGEGEEEGGGGAILLHDTVHSPHWICHC